MEFDPHRLKLMDTHIEHGVERAMEELARLVAVPSVAAQGRGIREGAELTATLLREHGYAAEILPTDGGSPVVVGEGRASGAAGAVAGGAAAPTLLFYLHYDVQPAEPLELWESDPFTLTRRGDAWYGRGASDDKGHIVCRLAALEAVKEAHGGALPLNVKFVIEGEEEIGSVHMPAFVERHRDRLAADACIWEFGGVDDEGRPEQILGMRGICYVELRVRTANRDAHSGLGGSLFPNAAWRLVWALASLKDPGERILIEGHSDHALPVSGRDLEILAAMPDDSKEIQERYGLRGFLNGMKGGVEFRKQAVMVPTCTICGITTGYQGAGSKTVLPAEASAKVDFRLVPEMMPEEVVRGLRRHLDAHGFDDVEISYLGGGPSSRTDPDHPFIRLANAAARDAYGVDPVVAPMAGGSGPGYPFMKILAVPVTACGISHPGAQVHAPNEHVRRAEFVLGVKHTARIIEGVAMGMARTR